MARSSIFVLCSLAICLRRFLLVLAALSLIYFGISNFFSIPANWQLKSDERSSTHLNLWHKKRDSYNNKPVIARRKTNSTNWVTVEDNELKWDLMTSGDTQSLLETVAQSILPKNQTLCPDIKQNPLLLGRLGQAALLIEELEEKEVEEANPDLGPGGSWKPQNCTARHKIGIVIPYRDRKSHLIRLLDFLIPVLKRQLHDFRFIVTEQSGDNLFNKGRIMNAAFRFGQRQLGLDCLVFHDVDMFPQDDRTPYGCPSVHEPRHVGAFVSNLGYQLWYNEIVGGVLAINVQDYEHVNGFSNQYWAWGGEDDDMGKRILSHNFSIERPNGEFVRFSMLKHQKRKRLAPKLVYKLLEEVEKRMNEDGVKELNRWNILKVDVRPLYYHLLVDVGEPPDNWKS